MLQPALAAVAVALFVPSIAGSSAGAGLQFAARTDLVEVYATVTDAQGQPVTGLPQDAFTVLEDGVARPIRAFAEGEFPLTLAIAVDRSWSMAGEPLAIGRRGALAAVERLEPDDAALVLAIGSQVEVVSALGRERAGHERAIDRLDPWGTSPLGDGIAAALQAVEPGTGRRALVLWSDGVERYSEQSREAVLAQVRRSSVLVYPVAIGRAFPPLFAELAALSGGRALAARDRDAAERAAADVMSELRHQYLLGYEPPTVDPQPGWHRIDVDVAGEDVRVRARAGYLVDE